MTEILILEEYPTINLFQSYVRMAGSEPIVVETDGELLEEIQNTDIKAIVSGLPYPRIDEQRIKSYLNQLSQVKKQRNIPVIICTARTYNGNLRELTEKLNLQHIELPAGNNLVEAIKSL